MRFDSWLTKKTFLVMQNMFEGRSEDDLVDVNYNEFVIKFSDDIKDWLGLTYNNVYSKGDLMYYNISDTALTEKQLAVNMTVTDVELFKETLKKTAEKLHMTNKLPLEITNRELYEQQEVLRNTKIDRKNIAVDCPLKDLSKDKTNIELKTLLVAAEYNDEECKTIFCKAQEDREFILKDFKDYPVFNNRMFIPITDIDRKLMTIDTYDKFRDDSMAKERFDEIVNKCKYIVISKNPVDYFYASYGNAFQSCFALNSQYNALYGTIPLCRADGHFMVYATTGNVVDVSVISGKKFHCPQMFWRSWGYADENCDLILDKFYRQKATSIDTFIGQCIKLLQKEHTVYADKYNAVRRKLYLNGADLYHNYNNRFTYFDGLRDVDGTFVFTYANGSRDTGCKTHSWGTNVDLLSVLKGITALNDIDFDKPYGIVDGILCNYNVCPKTGFMLTNNKTESVYAKYLSKSAGDTILLNYIDGRVSCSKVTSKYSNGTILFDENYRAKYESCQNCFYFNYGGTFTMPLTTLKNHLKEVINHSEYDCVILRIIEDTNVNVQVFRRK